MTDREEMLEIAKTKINQIIIPNDLIGVNYMCPVTEDSIRIDFDGHSIYAIHQNGYWVTTIEA